jgi:hypothetical protein
MKSRSLRTSKRSRRSLRSLRSPKKDRRTLVAKQNSFKFKSRTKGVRRSFVSSGKGIIFKSNGIKRVRKFKSDDNVFYYHAHWKQ